MPLRTSLYRKPSSGHWSSRGSKRREVFSVNMISLPLADFRHVSHIGNDVHADSFGDLSFLKLGRSLLRQSSQSEQNIFLASSPPPKPPRLNVDEAGSSESPDWSVAHRRASQWTNKSISLPHLDSQKGKTERQGEHNVAPAQVRTPGRDSLSSDEDEDSMESPDKTDGLQKDEDSGFSFSLDLGPSILDDVLQVMEKLHQ